jgi:hypothetical protein
LILIADIDDDTQSVTTPQTAPVVQTSIEEPQCGTVDYSFNARLTKRKQIEEQRIFNSIIKRISHLCP